jgi:hypothetical protein
LPPSWGGRSWTPERGDAAEAKYKKWLLLQCKHEDVALSPGPPGGELDIFWHFHILDTEAYVRDSARFSAGICAIPRISAQWGTPYRNTQGGCFAPNTARS